MFALTSHLRDECLGAEHLADDLQPRGRRLRLVDGEHQLSHHAAVSDRHV